MTDIKIASLRKFACTFFLSVKVIQDVKSVALTVLELLAFNTQKFRGSHGHGYAPFSKNF